MLRIGILCLDGQQKCFMVGGVFIVWAVPAMCLLRQTVFSRHDLRAALHLLRAGGGPLTLVSGPGAAQSQGPGWLGAALKSLSPSPEERHAITLLLDCGAAPGLALAALHEPNLDGVVLSPQISQEAQDRLSQIAVALGKRLEIAPCPDPAYEEG